MAWLGGQIPQAIMTSHFWSSPGRVIFFNFGLVVEGLRTPKGLACSEGIAADTAAATEECGGIAAAVAGKLSPLQKSVRCFYAGVCNVAPAATRLIALMTSSISTGLINDSAKPACLYSWISLALPKPEIAMPGMPRA